MGVSVLPRTCPPTSTLWVWPACAAFLGPSLGLSPHATSVHCLVVGVDEPISVVVAGGQEVTARSVLIPPRIVHQTIAPLSARVLFCYFDVNGARAHDLGARMRGHERAFATDHRAEVGLIDLAATVAPVGERIMETAVGHRTASLDPRVARTTSRLLAEPAVHVAAADMARLEGLSTSYFLRLFGAETGTSFRRFRLWARMLFAARQVAAGANLTRASVEAGFATPSHFSDAFSRMFGLSATALAASGARLVIDE